MDRFYGRFVKIMFELTRKFRDCLCVSSISIPFKLLKYTTLTVLKL